MAQVFQFITQVFQSMAQATPCAFVPLWLQQGTTKAQRPQEIAGAYQKFTDASVSWLLHNVFDKILCVLCPSTSKGYKRPVTVVSLSTDHQYFKCRNMKAPKIIITAFFLVTAFVANTLGQKPVISSIDKQNASLGEIISITGSNFGNNLADIRVFAGGAEATVTFVSEQFIEAQVPAGATFNRISVHNIGNGLIGYATSHFAISFSGQNGIDPSDFEAQVDYFAERGLYDICLCDFNMDGLLDIAAANEQSSSVSLFTNNSTPGNINYSKGSIFIGKPTININCGDLNGDGKPDLVVSEGNNGNQLYIFQNTTVSPTISFSSQSVTFTGSVLRRIEINDLDNNGKPELIITNSGSNKVLFLDNQSTIASVVFSPIIHEITIPQASRTMGLSVEDLNGDQLPEIVVNQFLTDNGNCFVIQNTSSPGNFQFNNIIELGIPGTIVNLKVGDIDGDGKRDIVATQLLSSAISIFLNETAVGAAPGFSAPVNFPANNRPWGLDFGDLDGDKKNDIIIGSISNINQVTVLNNNSTPGNLQFDRVVLNATDVNRNVKVGDVDGDAKPDIVFTSIDDTNLGSLASNVSIFRNRQCVFPEILNGDPITICNGNTERLRSTQAPGATYRWQKDSEPPVNTTDPFLDITDAGIYRVTVISDGGLCTVASPSITVNVDAGTIPGGIVLNSNSPVCIGEVLNLSVSGPPGTTYTWRGPDNFSSTAQNPVIAGFSEAMVGKYYVTPKLGNCAGAEESLLISSVETPFLVISNLGNDNLCMGDNTTLSVIDDPDFTYRWKKDGVDIGGAIGHQFTVTDSGLYTVAIGNKNVPGCSPRETPPYQISVFTRPTADFNNDSKLCSQSPVSFTNLSASDNNANVTYSWNFGDSNTSLQENPTHTYNDDDSYDVRLRVEYQGLTCFDEVTKTIVVNETPSVEITSENDMKTICPGGSVMLSVDDSYDNISWSNGSNANSITADREGLFSVEVTENGCSTSDDFTVGLFPVPDVGIQAETTVLKLGRSLQLTASGLADYSWLPDVDTLINDPSIASPEVTPVETTTFTVKGTDENGCYGEASITIEVREGKITDRINPHKLFSPNNDNVDDSWIIDGITNFPVCRISIFDQKGVMVFEASPYANSWDGTLNGKPLSQGVYYYVIECGSSEDRRAGAITLIR